MSVPYKKSDPYRAPALLKPVPEVEKLTPQLAARLNRVERISHDDPTAICTAIGWTRYDDRCRAWREQQAKRESHAALAPAQARTFFACRHLRSDFAITSDASSGLSLATWTEPGAAMAACRWVRGTEWQDRLRLIEGAYDIIAANIRRAA
jgi:hypothetical protein